MATARNARTRTTPARVSDKPKITGLNLDKLEREGAPAEPYRTVLQGRVFTIKDPLEEDWQDQVKVDVNNAVAMLKSLMDDAEWDEFSKIRMEAWMLVQLLKDVHRYYHVDAENEGNGDASPTY